MSAKNYSKSTKRLYRHWCKELLKHTKKTSIRHITQADIDNYLAWMVREGEYARATVNQAAIAIKHYAAANGLQFDIATVSTRHRTHHHIDTINMAYVLAIIDDLPTPYDAIARRCYFNLISPGAACGEVRSLAGWAGVTVHPSTFNAKVRAAAERLGLTKRVTAKMLQQSGIKYALADPARGVAWVREKTGLTPKTLKRYLSL